MPKLAARNFRFQAYIKTLNNPFSETRGDLYVYVNPKNGKKAPLLSDEVVQVVS